MSRRARRTFTSVFKADAVRLVRDGGQSIAKVAADLDVMEASLREWVKRDEIDGGQGPAGVLTTAERAELTQLRRDVKRLEMEREILKKATAFFAKESK